MEHSFDIETAGKYGIEGAIIIKHFLYWIMKNKTCGKHFHEGRYWTYGSVSAFHELWPYMTERVITLNLKRLIDMGVLVVGNFNVNGYDRTKWYAFKEEPEELKKVSNKMSNAFDKMSNGFIQNVKPIPDISTDISNIYTSEPKVARVKTPRKRNKLQVLSNAVLDEFEKDIVTDGQKRVWFKRNARNLRDLLVFCENSVEGVILTISECLDWLERNRLDGGYEAVIRNASRFYPIAKKKLEQGYKWKFSKEIEEQIKGLEG